MSSETHKSLKIVYGGDSHEIDAEVLIESLVSYSVVVQEASAYLSPESKVGIKIKAQKEGSFELLLDVVASAGGGLFDKEGVQYAAALITVVGGLYELKKFLAKNLEKGEDEDAGLSVESANDSVLIKTKNGEITVSKNVYHIYQTSEKAKEGLRNTFTKLKDAEEIESFQIIDPETGQSIFHAEKEDFSVMSSDKGESEQRKQVEKKPEQELAVFKVVFKENHKWEFLYNGVRIYALISDADFISKVKKGEVAFRSGDRITVDLEIVQIFNEAANAFVNAEYIITKVIKHSPRSVSTQEVIDFKPERGV